VHDGNDVDALRLDAIQKSVGELRDEHAPELTSKRRTGSWEVEESFVRCLNCADEIESETGRLFLVESGCRDELAFSLGFSPKRRAGFPDDLLGRNGSDLARLEFGKTAFGFSEPKTLDISGFVML
jgi:hypothetical protein